MPRKSNKDEDAKKKKPVPQKKRAGGRRDDEDDDSSVDSHGNIRGLIAYSSESESDESVEVPVKRRAAKKPEPKKRLPAKKRRIEPEPVKKTKGRRVVESESEDSEDSEDEEDGETLGSEDTDDDDENDFEEFEGSDDDDDEEDEDYEGEEDKQSGGNMVITFGMEGGADPMVPQRQI